MPYTLAELDAMSLEEAQALPFQDRDQLLDLIIADGRGQSTDMTSYRTGMYSDYFDEDLSRMLKVRAVKVLCRGTTSSGFDGVVVGETAEEQYRACFRHVETTLKAAKTDYTQGSVDGRVPYQHGQLVLVQPGIPGVHHHPAVPGGHRHHRIGPEAIGHRNRGVHCLPGGGVIGSPLQGPS